MTIRLDGSIVRGGGGSLPGFLAILAGAEQTGGAPLTIGEVMSYLDPTKTVNRTFFHRLGKYADAKLGPLNPVRIREGRCWLEEGIEPVEVYRGEKRLQGEDILGHFKRADASDEFVLFWQRPSVEQLSMLIDADANFAHGQLPTAGQKYANVLEKANELSLQGVAMIRLMHVARRLENYRDLHRFAHRLRKLSPKIRHFDLQIYFEANAELAFAWYDYSFKRDYDGALSRLNRIGSWCNRFTGLGAEWLNLSGLVTRRKALTAKPVTDRTAAAQSIVLLENALAESIAMNNPYQIQQSAANLANLLSLFGQSKHGNIVPSDRASLETVQLLRLAFSVCASFGIGRDDLFNPIFILAHTRRYGLSISDVADLLGGAATLAEFAHRALNDAGEGVRAREQTELLCLEGCHAAALEGEIPLFAVFAAAIAECPDNVHPSFRSDQAHFIEEIVAIAVVKHVDESTWTEALERLRETLRYIHA